MKQAKRTSSGTSTLSEGNAEEWHVSYQIPSLSYAARRELLEQVIPRCQTASLDLKNFSLNAFVDLTGSTRSYAIMLLNRSLLFCLHACTSTAYRFSTPVFLA